MDIKKQFGLVEALDSRDIRIENILFLPASMSGEAFNDVLWDLLENNAGEDLRKAVTNGGGLFEALEGVIDGKPFDDELFVDLPISDQRDILSEWFSAYRYRVSWPTLLVKIATPIRIYREGSSGYSFSWGWYNTRWIAGQTFREVAKHGLKWHNEVIEEAKAKATKAA